MTCPRCSECIGAEHHWLDNDDCADEADATHACKHCDALGDECETCDGEGGRTGFDGEDLGLCPTCKGYGVVERRAPEGTPTAAPGERAIEFMSGCPNCGEEPEEWSSMSEFDCAGCGEALTTNVREDDAGKHWSFSRTFVDGTTGEGKP